MTRNRGPRTSVSRSTSRRGNSNRRISPRWSRRRSANSGLEPDRLELEITETTLMVSDDVESKLREIEALGVRLSLDDFGTGYSSLGYLNRFPVKKVKIDRSFARQAIESPKTQAIISAISALAQDLSIDLVAEGVETDAQLAFMASKNIFLIQGYLYTRPRPIEELRPLLAVLARRAAPCQRGVSVRQAGFSCVQAPPDSV